MNLSKELQVGKAGEHFVCTDLIIKGYSAFLSDQGLPYDVLVDVGKSILKIQVRTTEKLVNCRRNNYKKNGVKRNTEPQIIYSFGLKRGKVERRIEEFDFVAFVALDIMKIAYLPKSELQSRTHGGVKMMMQFKTRRIKYKGRVYSNGTIRTPEWGKYFEDYLEFKP